MLADLDVSVGGGDGECGDFTMVAEPVRNVQITCGTAYLCVCVDVSVGGGEGEGEGECGDFTIVAEPVRNVQITCGTAYLRVCGCEHGWG